jgi:hypothetical protein
MNIKIPKGVFDAAWRGRQLRAEYRRGGTSVGMNTARLLTTREEIPLAKVLHIAKYFPRHAGDNLAQKNPPSNGYIAWFGEGMQEDVGARSGSAGMKRTARGRLGYLPAPKRLRMPRLRPISGVSTP